MGLTIRSSANPNAPCTADVPTVLNGQLNQSAAFPLLKRPEKLTTTRNFSMPEA